MWAFGNGVEAIKVAALWVLSEPGKPASLSSNTQWSLSLPVRTTGVQVPTQATRRLCWQWRRSGLCSPSCWWRVTSACVPTHHMDTVVSVIMDHLPSVLFSWRVSKRTEKSLQHMLVVGGLYCYLIFPFVILLAGILNDDGTLNNDASCLRLGEVALAYAQAGKSCFFFKRLFLFWKTPTALCFHSEPIPVTVTIY